METALLVVDMQIGLVEIGDQATEALGCVGELLRRARRAGVPVVHVQHRHASWAPLMAGAPTWRIHPDIAAVAGEMVIGKTADVIRHHNAVLAGLAHPDHRVRVVAGRDVPFEEIP